MAAARAAHATGRECQQVVEPPCQAGVGVATWDCEHGTDTGADDAAGVIDNELRRVS